MRGKWHEMRSGKLSLKASIPAVYVMLPSPSNFHTRGRAESPPRVPIKEPLSTSSPAALWNLKKVNVTRSMTKSLRQSFKPSAQDLIGQSSSCVWMKVYDAEIPETPNDSTNVTEDVSGGISRCIHTAWDTLKFSYKWKSWWRLSLHMTAGIEHAQFRERIWDNFRLWNRKADLPKRMCETAGKKMGK